MGEISQRRLDAIVARVVGEPDERAADRWLRRRSEAQSLGVVLALADLVPQRARVDFVEAARLARATRQLADWIGDDYARARALRATGHVRALSGDYQGAVACYRDAIEHFDRLGRDDETAITQSGGLLSLMYLGRYRDADVWADRARRTFQRRGDRLRLARLEVNAGNLLFRQDRFDEALAAYRRAFQVFRRQAQAQDAAIALRNMAVCHTNLSQFPQAFRTYERARTYGVTHGLALFVAEVDYNVAYVHYLRGEYGRAITLYRDTRLACQHVGDRYHEALCDLDQAEMFLDLNMAAEAGDLATSALGRFTGLSMAYEAAKATALLAMAANASGDATLALERFRDAHARFLREGNRVWTALIDVHMATAHLKVGQVDAAAALLGASRQVFDDVGLSTKTALCDVLLARADLDAGDAARAADRCRDALSKARPADAPSLAYEAYMTLGEALEVRAEAAGARRAFEAARRQLERLRAHVPTDELRVAFQQDRVAVYERLVAPMLKGPSTEADRRRIWMLVEQAKSRTLADLMGRRSGDAPRRTGGGDDARLRVHERREELSWYARQIDIEELKGAGRSVARLATLRQQARACEDDLTRRLRDWRRSDVGAAAMDGSQPVAWSRLRDVVPAGTTIIEYFEVQQHLHALLLDGRGVHLVPLGPTAPIRERSQFLHFQLSRQARSGAYTRRQSTECDLATDGHLRALHAALIAPLESRLRGEALVIVPHGFLHRLPFHALRGAEGALIDRFDVSYAPSATIWHLCCTAPGTRGRGALVMGVPDRATPEVPREVKAVAASLPAATMVLGRDATRERLVRAARGRRFLHLATHGVFRADNPLFSSIRLADGPLHVFDLYDLHLPVELVTLSGCGTGLGVLAGGDELLGLVRGWLFAGARSLLVSLWDVNDASTARLMSRFYDGLRKGLRKSSALRHAALEHRREYPHPYHWAPFVIIGDAERPAFPVVPQPGRRK